jgi:hypothetical protein
MVKDQCASQGFALKPVCHLRLHHRHVLALNSYRLVIFDVYVHGLCLVDGLGFETSAVKILVSGTVFARVGRVIDDVLGVRSHGLGFLIDDRLWIRCPRPRSASGWAYFLVLRPTALW